MVAGLAVNYRRSKGFLGGQKRMTLIKITDSAGFRLGKLADGKVTVSVGLGAAFDALQQTLINHKPLVVNVAEDGT